jgi:hypothetical protein
MTDELDPSLKTRFPSWPRTASTELDLLEIKFVDQIGILDSLKRTKLPPEILNSEENLSETGVSVCYPNYGLFRHFISTVPYAYISSLRWGVTWMEENKFKDFSCWDNSLVSRERTVCRDCISSKGDMGVERKTKKR